MPADSQHFDVLIVGAGISGIGAGYHLQTHCPDHSYAILESREGIGGTWDLFRYPGVRSDSDMYTLGYSFRPWTSRQAIADGDTILKYLEDTAREFGIDRHIRFRHRVLSAAWSSEHARWTLQIERVIPGSDRVEQAEMTCGFLHMCSGYYNYDAGYTPDFPGMDSFAGRIVHPQKWTDDIDYVGKRVVVIGSGATAITLVPSLAKTAAHVTMLQRSPSYVVALPGEDPVANFLRRFLPAKLAYGMVRWKNILAFAFFFRRARKAPQKVREYVVGMVMKELGPDYDVKTHFVPKYNPWRQRMCLARDGDLFEAIRENRVTVVTDEIANFTPTGIKLKSGDAIEADLIVTATGLDLQPLGKLTLDIDGDQVRIGDKLTYKGMMYDGVPNLASSVGYTNASWTLKCDLTSEYVCRLLNHMDKNGFESCTPRLRDDSIEREPFIDFSSGYVTRAIDRFPKQGSKRPWRLYQNYFLDLIGLRFSRLRNDSIEFKPRS